MGVGGEPWRKGDDSKLLAAGQPPPPGGASAAPPAALERKQGCAEGGREGVTECSGSFPAHTSRVQTR